MSSPQISPEHPEPTSGFAGLGLSDPVLRAVYDVGYETPSPIQAQTIKPLLEGRDILGQAQTGTGKTAAFALPLLSRLDISLAQPQILVLTPTRELAIQVAEAMQVYARYLTGFHVLPVYGGQSISLQLRALRRGIHAVVGTPGRILDHLGRGTLKLGNISSVVLDEADEMLRMGFIDDVEEILSKTPKEKQLALFSATLPTSIRKVADRHTRQPTEIRIKTPTATVDTISQRYWQVSGTHKLDALTRILETEDFDAMVIFVRTKIATTELADKLEARGFSSAPLNGDMNQVTRELTIERLKTNRLDILVATDVAARGLDVERVSHVVNYDIPYDAEAYIHRVGRTGRAGRKGQALLFVSPRERRMLRTIERATGQQIAPMTLPSQDEVANRRIERFKSRITEVLEQQNLDLFRSMIDGYRTEHEVPADDIAAALAFLAQGDRPLVSPEPQRPARKSKPQSLDSGDDSRFGKDTGKRSERRSRNDEDFDRIAYRLEVGANDDVKVKNIVGAIANEAGLDSAYIGAVRIHDTYSTIELPEGMPNEIFGHLKKVRVCGKALRISPLNSNADIDPPNDAATPGARPGADTGAAKHHAEQKRHKKPSSKRDEKRKAKKLAKREKKARPAE